MMSFVMVIKGPVAIAGSILNFSSVSGTIVPKIEANITTTKREIETEYVTVLFPNIIQLYIKTSKEIILALIKATAASFITCTHSLLMFNVLLAKP